MIEIIFALAIINCLTTLIVGIVIAKSIDEKTASSP